MKQFFSLVFFFFHFEQAKGRKNILLSRKFGFIKGVPIHLTKGNNTIADTITGKMGFGGLLEDAIATYGKPEIVNSNQGGQYTSAIWTQYLEQHGIQISMDGKGRALDKVGLSAS